MVGVRSYWLALASLPLIVLGAVSPWVTRFGVRVDGWQDEAVLVLGGIAACIVVYLARTERRWIAAGPFLIGLTLAALVANDIRDPGDVAQGAGSHFASLQWGIYLSLGGSATLALASALLLVDSPWQTTRRKRAADRSALWRQLPSIMPYVTAEHRDAVFIVPTEDRKAERFVHSRRPRQFVRLARAVKILREAGRLPEGGVIVDVGAHVGTTSIMALSRHGFAEAVSIEPDPENVRLLRASAAINGVEDRIRVIPAALSSDASEEFFVPGRKRGGWAEGRLTAKRVEGAQPIAKVRLDDLTDEGILNPETTRLIWCGHPVGGALIGSAQAFFARRIPIVIAIGANDEGGRAFLHHVEPYYEQAVDLRHNLGQTLSQWAPRIVPVCRIDERILRKHTDLLLF